MEVSLLEPLAKRPELRLTGNMGDVMRESAETAVAFVRSMEGLNRTTTS